LHHARALTMNVNHLILDDWNLTNVCTSFFTSI
jgi:hypothetical protein